MFNQFIFLSLIISIPLLARDNCDVSPVDLLVIGDSQTGATWGHSYFGNFLQKCLKNNPVVGQSFVIYGRGGTQPIHWLDNSGMDKIETIQRDPVNNHTNIGANDSVPLCKKRLGKMIETHRPKMVLAFFGDNLLHLSEQNIGQQVTKMIAVIKDSGIGTYDCFFMSPTYEMQVLTRRNVPQKNLEATQRINMAIKAAVADKCQLIDGLELMKKSPYLLTSNLLKRVQSEGMSGCLGSAGNDNIHICGEVAKDMSERVCDILKK